MLEIKDLRRRTFTWGTNVPKNVPAQQGHPIAAMLRLAGRASVVLDTSDFPPWDLFRNSRFEFRAFPRPVGPFGMDGLKIRPPRGLDQQAFEQQPQLAQFAVVVDRRVVARRDVDAQGAAVAGLAQLADEFAVFHFALADAHLQLVFRRIAELHVIDELQERLVIDPCVRAEDEVAGVEGDTESFDVRTHQPQRVRVLRNAADLVLRANADSFHAGDADEPPQMLDFFVERRAEFRRRHRDAHHLDRFGELAERLKALVRHVAGLAGVEEEGTDVQAIFIAADERRMLPMGDRLGRRQLHAVVLEVEFDRGELQVRKTLERFAQFQIGKTMRRGGDKQWETLRAACGRGADVGGPPAARNKAMLNW